MRQNLFMLSMLGLLAACSNVSTNHVPMSDVRMHSDGDVGTVLDVTDRVFFSFDKSNLSSESAVVLDELAAALLREENKGRKIRIEGRCDERGNREYNLGLGQRRANAVAKYLQEQGIDRDRMQIISYGKDMQYAVADGASIEEYYRINRVATVVLEDEIEIVEEHKDEASHNDAHEEADHHAGEAHDDSHDEHHETYEHSEEHDGDAERHEEGHDDAEEKM